METFIHQQYLNDLSICDRLVEHHKNDLEKTEGRVNVSGVHVVDEARKVSVDSKLHAQYPLMQEYSTQLQAVVLEYIKKFKYCATGNPWTVKDMTNIQYYPPTGGFKFWHYERSTASGLAASRHLVFMTYLNDVTDAGETEFFYQTLKVQPRKGLTLIWPSDWTHTHRGVPSPTQEKYIITGWFNYTEAREQA